MTKANWSKVGKKSRRKGKSFELQMAKLFREWFGYKWETSRNSGRTDVPGDIYCVDRPTKIMVECKHRVNWSIRDLIRENKGFKNNFEEVLAKFYAEDPNLYPVLWVFRKDELGIWVLQIARQAGNSNIQDLFNVTASLRMYYGGWHLLNGLNSDAKTQKIEKFVYRE